MMLNKRSLKMYCFSPPVMLATFLIEFGLAFYVIWRYKMDTVRRLSVITLLSLGTFQLAEYMICGGLGWTHVQWARVGYAAITLLPALGIHMVVALAGKKMTALVATSYTTCAAFLAFYVFSSGSMIGQECAANYAVFHTYSSISWLFGAYYYGWMFIGTILAVKFSQQVPTRKKALMGMAIGYMTFIIPTTFFNLVDPTTTAAIPSIMCGFAVLFAITLVIRVLPNSAQERNSLQGLRNKFQLRI